MPQKSARAEAWVNFFRTYPANYAVTLAYNPVYGGTASPAYRITGDGECLRLPTSGVPVKPGVNRLPTIRRITPEQVMTSNTPTPTFTFICSGAFPKRAARNSRSFLAKSGRRGIPMDRLT
jgi:hypothetical protein